MQLPCGYLVRMDSCSSREWRSPYGLRRFLFYCAHPDAELTSPITVARMRRTLFVCVEAIGSSIRMYVGGWLSAEGQENALRTGKYGLVTRDTAADFDNFKAIRP
jgi:hypothetical protein